jgi:hypothetical protein
MVPDPTARLCPPGVRSARVRVCTPGGESVFQSRVGEGSPHTSGAAKRQRQEAGRARHVHASSCAEHMP